MALYKGVKLCGLKVGFVLNNTQLNEKKTISFYTQLLQMKIDLNNSKDLRSFGSFNAFNYLLGGLFRRIVLVSFLYRAMTSLFELQF